MTRLFVTGWEHGRRGDVGDGLMNGGQSTSRPEIASGPVLTGSYSLRCGTNLSEPVYGFRDIPGGHVRLVRREYIYIAEDFASQTTLMAIQSAAGPSGCLEFLPGSSQLRARIGGLVAATGIVVNLGQWYLIDMRYNVSANPHELDIQVNGVALPQLTLATPASTLNAIRWGWTGPNTGRVHFDDIALDESGVTYPIGQGQVIGLSPDADGTHNPATPDCFETESGAALTVAFNRLDERPIGDDTQMVVQTAADATHYVEVAFENLPGGVSGIRAVQGIARFNAGGTATTRVRSNTTDTDIFVGNMAPDQVESVIVTPDGGSWSVGKVNALLARLGFATGVGTEPAWQAIMLEVEWTSATAVDISDSDNFSIGDASSNPGGGTPPPPTNNAVVEDDFDRANGAIGTSSSGDTWTTVDGTPQVISNEGGFTAAAPGYGGATLDPGAMAFPYTIACDIELGPTTNRVNCGLMFHSLGSRSAGLMFVKLEITGGNPNGLLAIGKHDGGVSYGPFTEDTGFVEGEIYQVDVVVDETSIHCYVTQGGDDTVDIQATYTKSGADQTLFNGTHDCGLRLRGGGAIVDEDDLGSRWDNFAVYEGDVHREPGEIEPPDPPPPPGGGGGGNGTLRELPEDSIWLRHTGWSSASTSLGRPATVVFTDTFAYVCGNYDQVRARDGTWHNRGGLCRVILATMDLDTTWDPGITPLPSNGRPRDLALSADLSLVVCVGDFTAAQGQTRPGIAVFNAVNGQLQSHFASWTKPGSGTLRGVGVDGTDLYIVGFFNNFGPAGQARNGGAKVTSWTTTPALDGTWLPDVENGHKVKVGTVTGGTKRVFICCDSGSGNGSVNGDTCDVAGVNATSGASVWFGDYDHNGPMDFDINDELQLVITGSRGGEVTGGNAMVSYAYAASGQQTYVNRISTNGNMQGVGFYKGGKPEPFLYGVHHGTLTCPAKNTATALQDNDQNANVTSLGLMVVDKNFILQGSPWRPRFMQQSSAVGGVLKGFGVDADEIHDMIVITGDHTQVRASDNSAQREQYRISFFREDEAPDPPDPPDPPPPGGVTNWVPSGFDGGGFVNCGGVNADGTILSAGSDVGGMSRSTDQGKSWTPANRGITARIHKEISSFGWHPTDPLVCVVGAATTLFLSEDGARHWQSVATNRVFEGHNLVGNNKGVPERHPRNTGRHFAWMFDGAQEFLFWGEFDTGCFISEDRGNNPVSVGLVTPEIIVRGVKAHGSTTNVVFVGAFQGVGLTGGLYRITNPWGALGTGNRTILKLNTPFNSVEEIDTLGDNIVVVGSIITRTQGGPITSQTDGVWRSQDNGDTWTRLGTGVVDAAGGWCAVKIHAGTGGNIVIYIGAGTPVESGASNEFRTILKSTNSGGTWAWITPQANVDPHMGDAGGDVWWQDNDNWWLSGVQAVSAQIEIDPINPNIVYSFGRSGVWRTETGGNQWFASMRGLCVATVLDCYYDDTQPGLSGLGNVDWDFLYSEDYFEHMTRVAAPMPGAGNGVVARTVLGSGSAPRELFISGGDRDLPSNVGGHIFSDTDVTGGGSWVDESGGDPAVWGSERCFGLAHREIGGTEHLLAGIQGDGIWRKSGATWAKVADQPLLSGSPDVQQVSISWEYDQVAYMVDRDSGLWRATSSPGVMDTWELIWAFTTNNRSKGYCAVDPSNSSIVYVSKEDGLFRLGNALTGTAVGSGITQTNMNLPSSSTLAFDENGWLYVTTVVGAGDVKFMRYQNPRVTNPVGVDLADDVYRQACVLPLCVKVFDGRAAVGCDGMGLIINNGLNENSASVSDTDTMTATDNELLNTGGEFTLIDNDSLVLAETEDAANNSNEVADSDVFQIGDANLPFEGDETPVVSPPGPGIIPPVGTQYFGLMNHIGGPQGQVSVVIQDLDAQDEPGGYTTIEGTLPLDRFNPGLFVPGSEWKVVGTDGVEAWYGWLLEPVIDVDRIRLTGRGTKTLADRNIRRMMFLSRNSADFVTADSDPHSYLTGDVYSANAEGSRIVFIAEPNDAVNPTSRSGIVFWAEGVQIHSMAFTFEWNGQGGPNLNVLRIQSAKGPTGQLVQEAGDIPLNRPDLTIDRNIAAPGERDLVWVGMHRVDNVVAQINNKIKMTLKNIRVRGLAHTDEFYAQDVVKEVCERLNVDTEDVQFDGVDLHALDQKDGSFGELLDLVSLISDFRWKILHRGNGLYCDFAPWDEKVWVTTRGEGPSNLYALSRYNRVAVRYRTPKGITRDVVVEPVDIDEEDPFTNELEVIYPQGGPVELPDRYNSRKTVEHFAGRLLKHLITPRLGGDFERTWLRDLEGNVVPAYHAMSGDTVLLQDFAPGQALAGRIVQRGLNARSCTFSLDSEVIQAERLIARATRDRRS